MSLKHFGFVSSLDSDKDHYVGNHNYSTGDLVEQTSISYVRLPTKVTTHPQDVLDTNRKFNPSQVCTNLRM
jgi:hypothetical protein